MSILNYEEMTLESDTFQAARETFNLMMQKLWLFVLSGMRSAEDEQTQEPGK